MIALGVLLLITAAFWFLGGVIVLGQVGEMRPRITAGQAILQMFARLTYVALFIVTAVVLFQNAGN